MLVTLGIGDEGFYSTFGISFESSALLYSVMSMFRLSTGSLLLSISTVLCCTVLGLSTGSIYFGVVALSDGNTMGGVGKFY